MAELLGTRRSKRTSRLQNRRVVEVYVKHTKVLEPSVVPSLLTWPTSVFPTTHYKTTQTRAPTTAADPTLEHPYHESDCFRQKYEKQEGFDGVAGEPGPSPQCCQRERGTVPYGQIYEYGPDATGARPDLMADATAADPLCLERVGRSFVQG